MHETLHARLDNRFGLRYRTLAHVESFLHHAAQVIDGIEINVIEIAGFRFDVARHRQIDHEHRPALALF